MTDFNPLSLKGRNILITGASSGIGRGCAVYLDKLGANLILCGRDEQRLLQTKQFLGPNDRHAISSFDMLDTGNLEAVLKGITAKTGPLDGAILSAGITKTMPLKFTAEKDINSVLSTNLASIIVFIKHLLNAKISARPCSLVLISSVTGMAGVPGISVYSASKAGLFGLCKSLAVELAQDKIRVNTISPGYVKTDMFAELQKKLTKDQLDAIVSQHPLGLGEADDVAASAAFLLSDASRWITGTNLVADGGYSAK